MNFSYEFGPFHLDTIERVLRGNGHEIVLRQKSYEVLLVLVENSGHIVEKETLMRRCWPDSFVEEANIPQNISALRKILRREGGNEQYIETIPKRGYRFRPTVRRTTEPSFEPVVPASESVTGYADNKVRWTIVLSGTIRDIDKPIAKAIEAHLKELSNDVTLTLVRVERGSVKLILESNRRSFELIYALHELRQLRELLGFNIEYIFDIDVTKWLLSSESVEPPPEHTVRPSEVPSHPKDPQAATRSRRALTKPAFDKLLAWLSADREQAGLRYEDIRRRLTKYFARRGAPEDLADETIDRAAETIWHVDNITVDLNRYIFRTARKIFLGYEMLSWGAAAEGFDEEGKCFEECLQGLSVEDRELFSAYYKDTEDRVRCRKKLAAGLGIKSTSLRGRICRIRKTLKECVSRCIDHTSTKESKVVRAKWQK